MDYKTMIERYGKESLEELLDYIIINECKNIPWMHYAKKYRIVGRGTQTVRGYCTKQTNHWGYYTNQNGERVHGRLPVPRDFYQIYIKNGRGQYKLQLAIYLDELDEIKEELNNA